jgi:L-Ala-D/L-Glu epimerase
MPIARRLRAELETWPLKEPFHIARMSYERLDTLYVEIEQDGVVGRGEAAGVDYLGDVPETALRQIEALRAALEAGASRIELQSLIEAGCARAALDCALWDLELKLAGQTIWQALDLMPREVQTVTTISVGTPAAMAQAARAFASFPLLKLKLDASDPVGCVAAVREARPDATLLADVNTGWRPSELQRHAPALARLGVVLIEQPVPPAHDAELSQDASPVRLGADESCQTLLDLPRLVGRYQVINIKLDKCGGLTHALTMVHEARRLGFGVMVGNMLGTSLAMAPAFVVAQYCEFVDLDGPLLLATDRSKPMVFGLGGWVQPPQSQLWG